MINAVPELPKSAGAFFNYTYTNNSFTGSIETPKQVEAPSSTIYIYRGFDTPQNATIYSCGPRCIWMWAHKSFREGGQASFHPCPISLSNVGNTTDPEHNVSDGMTQLAASAIALQGRPVNGAWTQFQFYLFGYSTLLCIVIGNADVPDRNSWDIHFKEPGEVGANMAEFAICSIASMALENPLLTIPNRQVPILGSKLEVEWNYVTALCAGIAAVHFTLAVATMYVAKSTKVQEDSYLVVARLLNPVLESMYQKHAPPRGYDIRRNIDGQQIGGYLYGPRRMESIREYDQ